MNEYNQQLATNLPLLELADTYGNCLTVSQDYEASLMAEATAEDQEVDLNSLENFLSIRKDLFALAESSLERLADQTESNKNDPNHRELNKRTRCILEEISEIESRLTVFLGDRLSKMKTTITQMQKAQPAFKRYASVGNGHNARPNRITRLE